MLNSHSYEEIHKTHKIVNFAIISTVYYAFRLNLASMRLLTTVYISLTHQRAYECRLLDDKRRMCVALQYLAMWWAPKVLPIALPGFYITDKCESIVVCAVRIYFFSNKLWYIHMEVSRSYKVVTERPCDINIKY